MEKAVIASAVRTPIGSLGGQLSTLSAPQLGAIAIKAAVERAGLKPEQIDEVIMGNVLSAGIGQAPARQAAVAAGLPKSVICTTVNKVCASGMKAVMMAANQVVLGESEIVVAGGMESMSNVPYYLPKERSGARLGHSIAEDGIIKDGLWDVYNNYHMGSAAELCGRELQISREDQDQYAIESYKRAHLASENAAFKDEMIPVEITDRKGNVTIVDRDEDIDKVKYDKIPSLRPVFEKDGTVTAANASSINDGAAALVITTEAKAKELGLPILAEILGQGSAEKEPEWFTTAPSDAIPVAAKRAAVSLKDVDLFEINEAFSVVCLANNKILELDPEKVNVNGGGVSMGHPLGCSGARIITTLIYALKNRSKTLGCAGICNGGGGASSVVLRV